MRWRWKEGRRKDGCQKRSRPRRHTLCSSLLCINSVWKRLNEKHEQTRATRTEREEKSLNHLFMDD